jgi:hypothetical protein
MAGTARSGGQNRKSVAQHIENGTYRADRHGQPPAAPGGSASRSDRRRVMAGLPPIGRHIAARLLDELVGWDGMKLSLLRAFCFSADRIEALQAAGASSAALARETRIHVQLANALGVAR